MRKWLGLGLVGVVFLIAGVWLITSGFGGPTGQILAVMGVVLILLTVVVFTFAPKWMLLNPKGRAMFFGVSLAGRLLKVLGILLIVGVMFMVYMTA